jgi:TRAP-type C4-dicarboxylate transport system substrate-binding protein
MSTHPTLPGFISKMTPAKFKALSKEDQRAYKQKANAWMKAQDAKIDQRNAKNHKTLAFGLAQLVQLDPAIEWEIVFNYLSRNNKVLIDRTEQPAPRVK